MRPFLLRMGLVKMLPLLATTTLPLASPLGWASPAESADSAASANGADRDAETGGVELDFLLFLGEQQQINGEWIDPVQLLEQDERQAFELKDESVKNESAENQTEKRQNPTSQTTNSQKTGGQANAQ